MFRGLCTFGTVLLLALAPSATFGGLPSGDSTRSTEVVWFDDIEGDVSGWCSVDLTAVSTPRFHWDSYMAFGGSGSSWWCGTFDYDADGGYGNCWDERLLLPPVDLSAHIYPVLTYAYRHDCEVVYDCTYVEAKSGGEYVALDTNYDGFQPWTDIGTYGFLLWDFDWSPFEARFRFVSNGWLSDEDGLYLSEGGAFACDNIKIYDYMTGAIPFYDSEPAMAGEQECTPWIPTGGDFWHVIDRACPALSDPHSWWCGDDSDTGLIPPNLRNGLFTPVVDLSGYGTVVGCTVRFAIHLAIPKYEGDYCGYYVTANGVDYYQMSGPASCGWSWWGDIGSCDGWAWLPHGGYDVSDWCPDSEITHVGLLWVMMTDDDGCGPGIAGDAGAMIDDVCFEIEVLNPVEAKSWGAIKAMFR
jgi:hypothetical protein